MRSLFGLTMSIGYELNFKWSSSVNLLLRYCHINIRTHSYSVLRMVKGIFSYVLCLYIILMKVCLNEINCIMFLVHRTFGTWDCTFNSGFHKRLSGPWIRSSGSRRQDLQRQRHINCEIDQWWGAATPRQCGRKSVFGSWILHA